MEELCAHIGSVTSGERHQTPLAKLRQNLGEVFVAALADPATIGMLLSTDGTLWQERLHEPEAWRPIETMTATRGEAVLRTVGAIASTREPEVEFRLDGSRIVGQPLGLKCACCRPKPLQAAPNPSFRLCWRKICLIRNALKNAEREELRALNAEAQVR
jgi:hypothetical protein